MARECPSPSSLSGLTGTIVTSGTKYVFLLVINQSTPDPVEMFCDLKARS